MKVAEITIQIHAIKGEGNKPTMYQGKIPGVNEDGVIEIESFERTSQMKRACKRAVNEALPRLIKQIEDGEVDE